MLKPADVNVIRNFINNRDLCKLVLSNPVVQNKQIVLEKNTQTKKIQVSNRFVYSQYRDDRIPLGQYKDPEDIVQVAKIMGCTYYDPEIMEDEIEKAKYNRHLIDAVLRNQRSTL